MMLPLLGALLGAFILCCVHYGLPARLVLRWSYLPRGGTKSLINYRNGQRKPQTPTPGLTAPAVRLPPTSDTPANGVTPPSPAYPFHALVIGINDYPNLVSLTAAARDADRIVDFLASDLEVPRNQIISLRNEKATRQAIIDGFRRLRDDPRISNGDSILIYYAGHGGSISSSEGGLDNFPAPEVQVIFPCDYGVRATKTSNPTQCIPDYTIAALLNDIAKAKGDNITVVLDSCHSASATRDASTSMKPRWAPVQYDIPPDLDAEILNADPTRSTKSRSVDPVLRTDQASHVLLAACGSKQKAWEHEGRGQFTTALLKTLKTCGVKNLTYHNLLISLPKFDDQTPHCYGANKSRTMFNSRVSTFKPALIPVTPYEGDLLLGAGAASGVAIGSIWELYGSTANDATPLGRFVAEVPDSSTTVVSPEANKDKQSVRSTLSRHPEAEIELYARQVGAGEGNELKVWFSPQVMKLLQVDGGSGKKSRPSCRSRGEVGYVSRPRDSADIGLEVTRSNATPVRLEIALSLFDPLAEKYKVSNLEQRKPVQQGEVETVLFAAAKWNWHLRRTNSRHEKSSPVEMKMYKVGRKTLRNRQEALAIPEPVPIGYRGSDATGIVELVASDRDLYGIKLSNKGRTPLYVKMFFFDATDFSIVHLFGHSAANGLCDPELPAKGELFIGDGGDGGRPLKFTISPDKQTELGYLKVFWSTKPLQLDDIAQKSAFGPKRQGRAVGWGSDEVDEWGTNCFALVQRSAPVKAAV